MQNTRTHTRTHARTHAHTHTHTHTIERHGWINMTRSGVEGYAYQHLVSGMVAKVIIAHTNWQCHAYSIFGHGRILKYVWPRREAYGYMHSETRMESNN